MDVRITCKISQNPENVPAFSPNYATSKNLS
jgi:hypothetical protein